MAPTLLAVMTLAPLVIGAVLGVALDAFASRRAALGVVLAGFVASALLSAWGVLAGLAAKVGVGTLWGVLHVGGIFATVGVSIAVLGGLALAGGWNELAERPWGGSLAGLMALGAAASVVVASASDLTLLLVGLELAAACAYALVASGRGAAAREAAMKYFIQGAIATGFFVFGMAVLVTVFVPGGDMDALGKAVEVSTLPVSAATAGIVLVLAALAFKAGAAPFHTWAPDAYESAPPESAAFLSAGPKLAAVSALAIFGTLVLEGRLGLPLSAVVTFLAITSVLVGSVAALRQRSYTRMLGYAGVAQVGYALIGLATTHAPGIPVFFTLCYALAATGTFLAASAVRRIDPQWDGSVDGLAGMGRRAPALSASLAILLISLAGIPPLLGFWAKLVVFVGALTAAAASFALSPSGLLGWLYVVAAAVGIVGSVISLGYYGAVLRALYTPGETLPPDADGDQAGEAPATRGMGSAGAVVVLIALLTVVLGLVPLFTGIGRVWVLFGS